MSGLSFFLRFSFAGVDLVRVEVIWVNQFRGSFPIWNCYLRQSVVMSFQQEKFVRLVLQHHIPS